MAKIFSPWSYEEVNNLNNRQKLQNFHPYTCGTCKKELIAYFSGWRCPDLSCGYTQNWAHKMDVEGTLLNAKIPGLPKLS